jgi:predicted amino acid racemase
MTIDGAGNAAAVYNGFAGGAVQNVSGGATAGLTTFRHGASTGANRLMWGETHTLTVLPRVLSDADLQAAVAAL